MKLKSLVTTALICLLVIPCIARPPKVIRMIPENGAANVKPGPTKIRILFDQDMGKGYSLCGSGENYPEIIGEPKWASRRALVFSTNLKPNHDYRFGINSQSAQNFKSVRGEPAEVLVVQFRTAGDGLESSGNSATVSKQDNQKAINELRKAIDNKYSYKDEKDVDWNELFEKYNDSLLNADNAEDFAKNAGLMLAHTKDKHIWLTVGEQHVSAYINPVTPNANLPLLPKLVPNFKKHNDNICTGKFPDGLGYIYIDSWSSNQKQDFDQLYVALKEFSKAPGLIIDVRGNGGGSDMIAQEFAGCFIDSPTIYAKYVYRDINSSDGFSKVHEGILQPNKGRPRYKGKVAVLSGPVVMSSCEAFVLMMKQVPNCKIIGEPTQGSSGNPKPHDLGNGVTVYLPSWKAMLPDGTCFEGKGIRPDVLIKARPDQITTKDPVIEAALKELRKPR